MRSVSALGGPVRDELPDVNAADLSPDGRTIAVWKSSERQFKREEALWLGPIGGELRRYEPPLFDVVPGASPNVIKFSPDGTKLLVWVWAAQHTVQIVPVSGGLKNQTPFGRRPLPS